MQIFAAVAASLVAAAPSAFADHHECCSPAPKHCWSMPKVHMPHWPVVGCKTPPPNCIKAPVVKHHCPKPVHVCCPKPVHTCCPKPVHTCCPKPVMWCMKPAPTCCKPKPTCCAPKVASCPSTPSCAAPQGAHHHGHAHRGHSHDDHAHTHDKAPAPAEKSLYDRLGGGAAGTAVVEKFVARAAGNPNVNFTRKGTDKEWEASPENVEKLKKHLVDLIGMVTGGPQKYTGRSMKESHAGMKITEAEFNALAGDLIATLNEFNVPEKEQNELVKIVAGTAPDIVEVKEKAPSPPRLGQ